MLYSAESKTLTGKSIGRNAGVPARTVDTDVRSARGNQAALRMQGGGSRLVPLPPSRVLQRKCACGGTCADCATEAKGGLQRRVADAVESAVVPPIVHDVLASSGQPLDAATRADMEPRFGHDFSQVRVHADEKAAESARAVNALAYTVGRNVVFGEQKYAPHSSSGRQLLAHELVHVMQQHSPSSLARKPLRLNEPDDAFEREADRIAKDFTQPSAQRVVGPRIQRQAAGQPMKHAPTVDPRCEEKMKGYISQHWIKEMTEKYQGKTCEDYDAFKTDVMNKLGEKEFQTFGEGDDSYECCVEYCLGISTCGPTPSRPGSGHRGGPDSGPPHYDKQISCDDPKRMFDIEQVISSKDGLSLTYGMAQLEPEKCKPPPLA